MWQLYLTATKTATRPSELIGVADAWAAYQFDNAVVMVGLAIENASQEMQKMGSDDKPEWRPKYTMKQLLDPDFRLPLNPQQERPIEADIKGVQGVIFDEVRS